MSDNEEFLKGQPKMKKFSDYMSVDEAMPPIAQASEYANVRLVMNDFEIVETEIMQDGERKPAKWAVIEAMNDELQTIRIRCGGYKVMSQLEKVNKVDALPCYFTLKKEKDGKTWFID